MNGSVFQLFDTGTVSVCPDKIIGLDNIYESLLVTSLDEPFTGYGLIAKGLKLSEDKSSITFFLNDNARWHDNKPITSHDVEWTFNTILEKGHPSYRSYYSDVKNIEIINNFTIKFHFKNNNNRELPIIIGQMKILPKHFCYGLVIAELCILRV